MKRIALAAAMALSAVPALAADLPPGPPPPRAPAAYVPTVAPAYNWSGFYFGINGGYGFGTSDWDAVPGFFPGVGNFDLNGGLVGSTIGFNFQASEFVFGVEGDIDWTDIKGSTNNTTICGGTSCTFATENDWLGTVRGRVGYAWDRVLVYATGGGAFGNIKSTFSTPGLVVQTNNTEFGWTAGGGVEVGITNHFTAKAEYLFVDLTKGAWTCTPCGGGFPSVPVTFDASLVRAGLNYKFAF